MGASAPNDPSRPVGQLGIEDIGSGQAIVLIHGLATTRLIWRHVTPLLARSRRVLAVDVPGFGSSLPAGLGFDLDEVAIRIADGLSGADIREPVDLVGHSMGGAVALRLATLRPEMVRRLVLVAPAGLRPISAVAAQLSGQVGGGLVALRRHAAPLASLRIGRRALLAFGVADPDAIDPDDIRAMARASKGATRVRAALAAVGRSDMRADLVAARSPIGAIWGEKDRVISPAGIGTLLVNRPDAVVAIVPQSGHIAMMERPESFVTALDDVLARLS